MAIIRLKMIGQGKADYQTSPIKFARVNINEHIHNSSCSRFRFTTTEILAGKKKNLQHKLIICFIAPRINNNQIN